MAYELPANRHWESFIHSSENVPLAVQWQEVLFNMWCWGSQSNVVMSAYRLIITLACFSTVLSLHRSGEAEAARFSRFRRSCTAVNMKCSAVQWFIPTLNYSGISVDVQTSCSRLSLIAREPFPSCCLMTRKERVKQFAVALRTEHIGFISTEVHCRHPRKKKQASLWHYTMIVSWNNVSVSRK